MTMLGMIYQNPLLPHDYYMVKLVDVQTENCGGERPRLCVAVQTGPMYPKECAWKRLHCVIHPTEGARFLYLNFVNAFRISGTNYIEGLNRWASVEIYPAKYDKTEYSAVKFTHQPPAIRIQALAMEKAEATGHIDKESFDKALQELREQHA